MRRSPNGPGTSRSSTKRTPTASCAWSPITVSRSSSASVPCCRVIRSAAVVDRDGAALWQLIQTDFHANQQAVVESLASQGGLRADLTVEQATDVLWTLNHPDVWLLFIDRGWTPEAFEDWFADTLVQQLHG